MSKAHSSQKFKNVNYFTLLLFMLLVACQQPRDEAAVLRELHQTMAQAAGERNLKKILANIRDDFLGNQSIRKAQLQGIIFLHFQRNPSITVLLTGLEVTVNGEEATSQFKLLLTGSEHVLPERLRWLEVNVQWVRMDDDWLIQTATWQDVGSSSSQQLHLHQSSLSGK